MQTGVPFCFFNLYKCYYFNKTIFVTLKQGRFFDIM